MSVVWTVPARQDLKDIFLFIAKDKPRAAENQVRRIEAVVDLLADHPYLGRQSRRRGLRELVIARAPYIAFYRVHRTRSERTAEVLRIIHGARNRRGMRLTEPSSPPPTPPKSDP